MTEFISLEELVRSGVKILPQSTLLLGGELRKLVCPQCGKKYILARQPGNPILGGSKISIGLLKKPVSCDDCGMPLKKGDEAVAVTLGCGSWSVPAWEHRFFEGLLWKEKSEESDEMVRFG